MDAMVASQYILEIHPDYAENVARTSTRNILRSTPSPTLATRTFEMTTGHQSAVRTTAVQARSACGTLAGAAAGLNN